MPICVKSDRFEAAGPHPRHYQRSNVPLNIDGTTSTEHSQLPIPVKLVADKFSANHLNKSWKASYKYVLRQFYLHYD